MFCGLVQSTYVVKNFGRMSEHTFVHTFVKAVMEQVIEDIPDLDDDNDCIDNHNEEDSIDSLVDYEDDDSDFSETETLENISEKQNEKQTDTPLRKRLDAFADVTADLFIRKRAERFIDFDEGFVSREESEYRLLILFLSGSLIIGFVATSLLVVCPFYCVNPKIIVWEHNSHLLSGTYAYFMVKDFTKILKIG